MPIRRLELWHFRVTDPATGRRYTPRYRMTMEEARARYKNPEVVIYSLEAREVNDDAPGHGQGIGTGAGRRDA